MQHEDWLFEMISATVAVMRHDLRQWKLLAILLFCASSQTGQAQAPKPDIPMNIHTAMMEATCKITGKKSIGTGFIIGKPDPKAEGRFHYTLVTANHVLAGETSDSVTLSLRQQTNPGQWERIDLSLVIREKGKDLWSKHPDVDLAAMHLALPAGVFKNGVLPLSLLLTDDKIQEYQIGPGTELLCLGYPLGAEANPEGFPILRSGKIASYPLLPTKTRKTFLFDFKVFQGNSGGLVYLYLENPSFGDSVRLGMTIFGLMGVVTNEQHVIQKVEQIYESREVRTPLSLAGVIPASFIAELISTLPAQ